MRMFLFTLAALGTVALAACSSDNAAPQAANLTGNWHFSEALADSAIGLSCSDTATYAFTQTGQAFTATFNQGGTCTFQGQQYDDSGAGTVTNGQVSGSSITFTEVPGCAYQGSISGSPASSAAGTVMCTDTTTSPATVLSGNWSMQK